jgi:hypothetical protein
MSAGRQREQRRERRSARRIAEEQAAKRRQRLFLIGGVGAALAIAAVLILVSQFTGGSKDFTLAAAPTVPANGRVLGDPNAPIKIVEFGDFQ